MLNERLFAPTSGASGWRRLPTIAAEAMVATSHPLATRAGVRALEAGGNAVDAALAAAAMLTVCEPPHNGVGGDAFAQLWFDGELHGLNGSGRAPAHIDEPTVDSDGPRSVTVPGAVRAWADAAERFGRLGLDAALAGAIDAARNGVAATARIAEHWRRAQARAPWPAPRPGERYRLPDLARCPPIPRRPESSIRARGVSGRSVGGGWPSPPASPPAPGSTGGAPPESSNQRQPRQTRAEIVQERAGGERPGDRLGACLHDRRRDRRDRALRHRQRS